MQVRNSLFKSIVRPCLALALLVVMVMWMAGAFHDKVQPGQISEIRPDNLQALKDSAFVVMTREEQVFEPVPGGIEAKQNSTVSSRILAKIEKVNVRAGQKVEKGQVLVELEMADLVSRRSQAEAALLSVEARLLEAKRKLKRSTELSQKGLIANAALEQAEAEHDSLHAARQSAEQALVEAETALNYAQIRSPIAGLVVDRFAEPGTTAQPGMPLLTLYNPETLRVEAHIREQLAVRLSIDDELAVTVPSIGKTSKAVIEEMVPAGNTASRTFLVKARIDETGLMPGMYAQLKVPVDERARLLIPQGRIAEAGMLNVVWVLGSEGATRRLIRVGKTSSEGMVEVISGLEEGELLLPIQNSR